MYKLIRFYNQNRGKIFKIILIIVFIIAIIQLLNYLAKMNKENDITQNNVIINNSNIHQELISNKSAVSGENISSKKLEKDVDIIDEFFINCKNGNIKDAYELVTDDCKEVMFPSIEDFENIYYIPIFDGEEKTYTVYNWIGNIYKVQINDDILSTGKFSNDNSIVDYITVVKDDNDKYKLNINSFIEREEINKEITVDGINIKIIKSDIYMDYSVYTFEVENSSDRTILLDDLTNIDTLYLEDSNNIKYSAYTHELTKENLKLGVSQKKKIDIKYYNKYSSKRKISRVCFSNIIYDYEEYESLDDKNQYNDFCTINIKI